MPGPVAAVAAVTAQQSVPGLHAGQVDLAHQAGELIVVGFVAAVAAVVVIVAAVVIVAIAAGVVIVTVIVIVAAAVFITFPTEIVFNWIQFAARTAPDDT